MHPHQPRRLPVESGAALVVDDESKRDEQELYSHVSKGAGGALLPGSDRSSERVVPAVDNRPVVFLNARGKLVVGIARAASSGADGVNLMVALVATAEGNAANLHGLFGQGTSTSWTGACWRQRQ